MREEVLLEIGARIIRLLGPLDALESLRTRKHFFDPLKIRQVVGLDAHFAAGRDELMQRDHELILKQTPLVVVALGPGIGKADVNHFRTADGQQPLRGVEAFETEDAGVQQSCATDGAGNFFHAPQQPLGAEEISLRVTIRHREKKSSVATAEVNFQRCSALENLTHLCALEMIFGRPYRALCSGDKCGVLLFVHAAV